MMMMMMRQGVAGVSRKYVILPFLTGLAFLGLYAFRDVQPIKMEMVQVNDLRVQVVSRGTNVQAGDKEVHLTTAVHYDDYPDANSFNILLNGWARHDANMDFKCCLISSLTLDKTAVLEVPAKVYNVYKQWIVDMQNAEFSCSVPKNEIRTLNSDGDGGDRDKPYRYVTFAEQNCSVMPKSALEIEYPKRVKDSVGICLKISYGDLDLEKMLEWFEYVKLLGVTRVFTFLASDLDAKARNAFLYYAKTGLLETNPIDPAVSRNGTKRGFKRPRYEKQAWVDEVMACNDCKHRMSGLDYVIIQDIDEFIVPRSPTGSYLSILKEMSERHPKAGAFIFNSYVVALDWAKSRSAPTHLMSRIHRTSFSNYLSAGTDTRWAFMPHRVVYARNNWVYKRKAYTKVVVPKSLCILQHRRYCKKGWKNCSQLSARFKVRDPRILRYEERLVSALRGLPLENLLAGANHSKYMHGLQTWRPNSQHDRPRKRKR